jgi:hypothetical protein
MTKNCLECLGCNKLEDLNFHGINTCSAKIKIGGENDVFKINMLYTGTQDIFNKKIYEQKQMY